jgi:hypothetical protein
MIVHGVAGRIVESQEGAAHDTTRMNQTQGAGASLTHRAQGPG